MEPENEPLKEEIPFGKPHFKASMFVFGRVKTINIKPIHPGIYMDLPSWTGGRSLENMHGIVNNQLSPPIHDMDMRKWNLELNKVWIDIFDTFLCT